MGFDSLSIDVAYHLSHEYKRQAYLNAQEVEDEGALRGYYMLISMAIKCLEYIKGEFPLSMDQDYQVTIELVEMLMKETHDLDLAEQYLSSLKERLKNHHVAASTDDLLMQRMCCEFYSLYELPLRRNSRFHYKIASRNCNLLLQYFRNACDQYEIWRQLFEYIGICLDAKLGKSSKAQALFIKLDNQNIEGQWGAFITLSHVSLLVSNRSIISSETYTKLNGLQLAVLGPQLYCWKMILQLYIKVLADENISEILNHFKQFFTEHKGFLLSTDGAANVNIAGKLNFRLKLPCVFQYNNLKNVLLLLQSVSFLVNCYDKKANFSTKFLPKVKSNTIRLIESDKRNNDCKSLNSYDEDRSIYEHILSCVNFYQKWETFLITSQMRIPKEYVETNDTDLLCFPLLEAMELQTKGDDNSIDYYERIIDSKQANEIRLIAMINVFIIRASKMSRNIRREEHMAHCNVLWAGMNNLLKKSDFRTNQMWECTIAILWFLSHLEPFTSSPMPSTEEEMSKFFSILRKYYMSNTIVNVDSQEIIAAQDEKFKMKKGALLQTLLNYLGGRLLEQDLGIICQLSGLCFKLSKQQNCVYLQYVVGIWHLLNCTVAMNSKEMTIMKSKLETIVKNLVD